jgi:hypothetical protein
MAFNRAKDCQRILQEDPEMIGAWFKLVEDTKAKYGVHDNDVHNFDDTGFQMGVIGSIMVVTGAERCTRSETPPFIVYKRRAHISAWYWEVDTPRNWKLSVSENGWTNNALGPE